MDDDDIGGDGDEDDKDEDDDDLWSNGDDDDDDDDDLYGGLGEDLIKVTVEYNVNGVSSPPFLKDVQWCI